MEGQMRVAAAHTGAEFEQGRTGHRNGEAPNNGQDQSVVDAREPEQTRPGTSGTGNARQRGMEAFLTGAASNQGWSGAPGRQKRQKTEDTEGVRRRGGAELE